MILFSQSLNALESVLRLALLTLLFLGYFRKFPVFSVYVVAAFLGDLLESGAYYSAGQDSTAYRQIYWNERTVLDVLLFLVVISFTYSALKNSPLRATAAKALGGIAIVGLALPLVILPYHHSSHHGPFTSQWFNHVQQIFNFAAAIMNLVLWGALLANRKRDSQLVTICIGVGVLTSSSAIAWGVRRWLSESERWTADLFMLIANIACLLLWCWVFRPKARQAGTAVRPAALTTIS